MNGSVVYSFFNTCAPTIEEYLPLDEELSDYVPHQSHSHYNYGAWLKNKYINMLVTVDWLDKYAN